MLEQFNWVKLLQAHLFWSMISSENRFPLFRIVL